MADVYSHLNGINGKISNVFIVILLIYFTPWLFFESTVASS